MMNFNTNTSNNDEWLTPPYIVKALGKFDLDPCAPINRPWDTADKHYDKNIDGLSQEWEGRVWLNPPYGRDTFKWIDKLSEHGNGTALIFARTETKGFHEHIWKCADAIFFFEGRLKFHYVDGTQGNTANAPSCLIAYGRENVQRLQLAELSGDLKGEFIFLGGK